MIILASGSPRRQELLAQIGAEFRVCVSDAEEVKGDALPPEELVLFNASAKAKAVAQAHPEAPVLGADTVVSLAGHTYGKPDNRENAKAMLQKLSGNVHEVTTGVALVKDGKCFTDVVTTRVAFADLTAAEIAAYVATDEPLDKAGAYAIQGRAAVFIRGIEGSYSNVVGLPLHAVAQLARKAGVDLYGHHGKGFTA